ncbi:MAG: hypothetical protein GY812_06350 [Actinomycetia bacterium]|nr:hypothetical protein [Actinomycetes bacterium]
MRGLPWAAAAIGIGAVMAVVARLRGSSPEAPAVGGWRDLELSTGPASSRPASVEP